MNSFNICFSSRSWPPLSYLTVSVLCVVEVLDCALASAGFSARKFSLDPQVRTVLLLLLVIRPISIAREKNAFWTGFRNGMKLSRPVQHIVKIAGSSLRLGGSFYFCSWSFYSISNCYFRYQSLPVLLSFVTSY